MKILLILLLVASCTALPSFDLSNFDFLSFDSTVKKAKDFVVRAVTDQLSSVRNSVCSPSHEELLERTANHVANAMVSAIGEGKDNQDVQDALLKITEVTKKLMLDPNMKDQIENMKNPIEIASQNVQNSVADISDQATKEMSKFGNLAMGTGKNMASTSIDTVKSVLDNTPLGQLHGPVDKAVTFLQDGIDKTMDVAENMKDTTLDVAENIKDSTLDAAENLSDKIIQHPR